MTVFLDFRFSLEAGLIYYSHLHQQKLSSPVSITCNLHEYSNISEQGYMSQGPKPSPVRSRTVLNHRCPYFSIRYLT